MLPRSMDLYDATVSSGTQYSGEIANIDTENKSMSIAVKWNHGVGDEDLVATLVLEAYNGANTGWMPEPLGDFLVHPAGSANKTRIAFSTAMAMKWRVAIQWTSGSGLVSIDAVY